MYAMRVPFTNVTVIGDPNRDPWSAINEPRPRETANCRFECLFFDGDQTPQGQPYVVPVLVQCTPTEDDEELTVYYGRDFPRDYPIGYGSMPKPALGSSAFLNYLARIGHTSGLHAAIAEYGIPYVHPPPNRPPQPALRDANDWPPHPPLPPPSRHKPASVDVPPDSGTPDDRAYEAFLRQEIEKHVEPMYPVGPWEYHNLEDLLSVNALKAVADRGGNEARRQPFQRGDSVMDSRRVRLLRVCTYSQRNSQFV
ncbi:hypothetical protein AB1Y20_000555 [Prymnesium parvum]|uniref:SET domain-containing protein n=1 Tax=Prymnesium parvum TaxID=97485 RepID=A0AB34K8N7_PRYPA